MIDTFCHPDDIKAFPGWIATPIAHDWVYQIRQKILDNTVDKVIMLDDDFKNWSYRRADGRYTKATIEEIDKTFKEIESYLDEYPVVGIGQRFMANNRELIVKNGRVNGAIGINADKLRELGVKFRLKTMEDFDLVLQLLTRGIDVMSYSQLVYEQDASGTAGGCSTYRTIESHSQGAKDLAALYPDFVRVVEKETKGSWGGQARLDVTIQWKKARASHVDR